LGDVMLAVRQSLPSLTSNFNRFEMLKLAVRWTLFISKFIRAQRFRWVNPVGVGQGLQTARNTLLIVRMKSVSMKIAKRTFVRRQRALSESG